MANPRKTVTSIDNQYTIEQTQNEQRKVQHKKRLIRRLSFFLVFAVAIGGLLVSSMVTRANALEDKLAEKAVLEEQIVQLELEEKKHESDIEKLNDDEYIAKLARKDYFLTGKNEINFNLPEEAEASSSLDKEADTDLSE
ncbi:FtsB family cell division protein [Jeotgalibacillus marinus]|uniref:Septum formation initiator family protein n=1 Tax=Jeotgalibacillus marinus TaxID=86667 RepID=A0ABV3Q6J6_9BACL